MVKDKKLMEFENSEYEKKRKILRKDTKTKQLTLQNKDEYVKQIERKRIENNEIERESKQDVIFLLGRQDIDDKIVRLEQPIVLILKKVIKFPFYLQRKSFEDQTLMLYPLGINKYVFYCSKVEQNVVYLLQEQNGDINILRKIGFKKKREIFRIMVLNQGHVLIILRSRIFEFSSNVKKKNTFLFDWEIKNGDCQKVYYEFCPLESLGWEKENMTDQILAYQTIYFGRIYVFSESSICCFVENSCEGTVFRFSRILQGQRLDFKWRVLRVFKKIEGRIIRVNCHSKIAHSFSIHGNFLKFKFLFLRQKIMGNIRFNSYEIENKQVEIDICLIFRQFDEEKIGLESGMRVMNIVEIGVNEYYFQFWIWKSKRMSLLCLIEFQEENGVLRSSRVSLINSYFGLNECMIQFCEQKRLCYGNCRNRIFKNLDIFYVNSLTGQVMNKERMDGETFYYYSRNDDFMKYSLKLRDSNKDERVSQIQVKRMKSGVYLPYCYFFFIEEWIEDCDEDILYEVSRLFDGGFQIMF